MRRLLYILAILLGILIVSCENEDYYLESDAELVFSVDTLEFDTVFTKIGSVTRHFKVYNKYSKDLKIEKVSLAGGESSMFRINVDGIAQNSVTDLVLRKQDSMYVFVEVTVNPNEENLPFIVSDSIIFEINGNAQDVDITAFGQNVEHISISHNDSVIYIDKAHNIKALYWEDTILKADKPYLIHDHIYIDTLATLKIEPGVTLYMGKDINLYVGGSLVIEGSKDMPVIIRGDRLDELYTGLSYDKVPGQWGYIHLLPGSRNSSITYTEIRNGNIGIQIDSSVVIDKPSLRLSYSKIENMLSVGLYAIASDIEVDNSVIANCGQYGVALTKGGSYLFEHCTLAGYYNWGGQNLPFLTLTNYSQSGSDLDVRELKRAEFNNCIVYGTYSNELNISLKEDSSIENYYKFNHCLLKVGRDFDTTDVSHFNNIIWNKDPKFVSTNDPFIFALDTLSPAIARADTLISAKYQSDLNGSNRLEDNKADIGAYEYVSERDE